VQTGYFRTNCIDCLDRTNVSQSVIAREVLMDQLKLLRLLPAHATDLSDTAIELEVAFKHLWADNGDALSLQYAGTGALKGDFTRTGQVTWLGLLNDGRNALTRYVRNNWIDGYRQDALDLFLGYYEVDTDRLPAPATPLLAGNDWKTGIVLAAVVSCAMLMLCLLVSSGT
jgi:hypothetical protein